MKYEIAASLLSADFARLGEEAAAVLKAGADCLHFDVMDNHYVPNLTVGPLVCSALRQYGIKAPIDVHLMVEPVDALIEQFAKAGASYISFHPEASKHVDRSLNLIKSFGLQAGLALNPGTAWEPLIYLMDKIDFFLLMSVNPGFAGQQFIPSTLKKAAALRTYLDKINASVLLAIDGGVSVKNIAEIAKTGIIRFIAGTAIFSAVEYQKCIQTLRNELMGA